jgi:hypothetical protein
LRIVRAPRSGDVTLALALAAGIALQAWGIVTSSGSRHLDPLATSLPTLAKWYGFQVLETSIFGIGLRDLLVQSIGVAASATLVVCVLAILLIPAARAARRDPFVAAIFAWLHFGFYFLPVTLAGTSPARYAITSILLLYAFIAWGFAMQPIARIRMQCIAATVLLAVITALDFAPLNSRADGPRWSEELSKARAACSTGHDGDLKIPIAPQRLRIERHFDLKVSWAIEVPCVRLVRAGRPVS